MIVPNFMLNHKVVVENKLGSGAYGDKYDSPITVRSRLEGSRKRVITSLGKEITCSAFMIIKPDADVHLEAKVTYKGITYTVVQMTPEADLIQDCFWEVYMA